MAFEAPTPTHHLEATWPVSGRDQSHTSEIHKQAQRQLKISKSSEIILSNPTVNLQCVHRVARFTI